MKSETIVIPKELRAELEAAARPQTRWTPEADAILREYAGHVSSRKLAEIITKHYFPCGRCAVSDRIKKLKEAKP